jgi:zinc/manganese transport system permease protein
VAILVLVAVSYRPLLFSSIDEDVAEARGVPTAAVSLVLLMLLAATTSIATPVVGVLLTFSLLIAPAATAALLTSRPGIALALAVGIGVVDIWTGLALSYWVDVPPSVVVTGLAFLQYLGARMVTSGAPGAGGRRRALRA